MTGTPEALAARVLAGDRGAEQALLESLRPGLLIVLRHGHVPQSVDAEDIVQETLRIVLERLRCGSIADPQRLFAFAAQTARNLATAARRKWVRQRTIVDSSLVAGSDLEVEDDTERIMEEELARAALQVLDELPRSRDRLILVRFYVENVDKSAICSELGLSELHFNRVLFRARGRFRRLLEERMPALGPQLLASLALLPLMSAIAEWVRLLAL